MRKHKLRFSIAGSVVALITLVGMIVGAFYVHGGSASAAPATASHHYKAHPVHVHPDYHKAGRASDSADTVVFSCQKPTATVKCYAPQQIHAAYGFNQIYSAGITGAGRTIVIVDAFQSPTIRQDLALFDKDFGLPNPTLNIIAPQGLTPFDPTNGNEVGWSAEISLDVEWAHAIAPGATIDLVLAKSNMDVDLFNATFFAITANLGDVISQSFGENEACVDPALLRAEHFLYALANTRHITLLASSGDSGAAELNCTGTAIVKAASWPASDPLVTAVGGTKLFADLTTGTYDHEVTWNASVDVVDGASGGGFSVIYNAPNYQQGVAAIDNGGRGVPDVAYDASVDRGVLVAWGVPFGVGAFFIFGGTSSGSPQWAGLTALADQWAGHRLGFLNKAIYNLGLGGPYSTNFHDITVGNNSFDSITGFSAEVGWDAATGWGSPKANKLVPYLAANVGSSDGFGL